ncbi:class I SAM-dependent methyltransferase [Streptomyces sp. NPDC002911]
MPVSDPPPGYNPPTSSPGGPPSPGYSLMASLGKRVLRPGGAGLTREMLDALGCLRGLDVVELAPGAGRTAHLILAGQPRSYVGIERDPQAVAAVDLPSEAAARVFQGEAARTGLPEGAADIVVGEALLSMQGDKAKDAILAEVARVLRPEGRFALHELALVEDDIDEEARTDLRRALAQPLGVNVRPQTLMEWTALLAAHGMVAETVRTAPMALLEPGRIIADEGLVGASRLARNVLTRPADRRRIVAVRRAVRTHRRSLTAVAIIARKSTGSDSLPEVP